MPKEKYIPQNPHRLNVELTDAQYEGICQFIPYGLRKRVVVRMIGDMIENIIDRPIELGKAINNNTMHIVVVDSVEEYNSLRCELKQRSEDATRRS